MSLSSESKSSDRDAKVSDHIWFLRFGWWIVRISWPKDLLKCSDYIQLLNCILRVEKWEILPKLWFVILKFKLCSKIDWVLAISNVRSFMIHQFLLWWKREQEYYCFYTVFFGIIFVFYISFLICMCLIYQSLIQNSPQLLVILIVLVSIYIRILPL